MCFHLLAPDLLVTLSSEWRNYLQYLPDIGHRTSQEFAREAAAGAEPCREVRFGRDRILIEFHDDLQLLDMLAEVILAEDG